jgi:predicted class III extradiol MEMO1 family dioxygenase
MAVNSGLQHCIGQEVSRFEEGNNDFIESVDDMCIHYDGGRVVANESLITEISKHGLRRTTKQTRLDRKTIRAIQMERKKETKKQRNKETKKETRLSRR